MSDASMDLEEVMKAILDKKSVLEARVDDLRAQLFDAEEELDAFLGRLAKLIEQPAAEENVPTRTPARHRAKTPAKERLVAGLGKMAGTWLRTDLHNAVNADGEGSMPTGTFAPIFSKLVKSGDVVEVEPKSGSRPAKYMTMDEWSKRHEGSEMPDMRKIHVD